MKKLLLIAIMLGIGGVAGIAAPLCTNVVTTAADFQALGNIGCQFGDKIFYGFTYTYNLQDSSGNNITAPPDTLATNVFVTFSNLGSLTFMPVVSFSNNWDVINGQQGDVRISYNVSAPLSAAMYSSSLRLNGYVSNIDPANQFPSYISGAETICCPLPGNAVANLGVELDADPAGTAGLVFTTGYDQVNFPVATQISISKDIFISAGSDSGVPGGPPNGNEATLTQIDEGLIEQTSVPEPLSFILFGSGLISMVVLTKRIGKLKS